MEKLKGTVDRVRFRSPNGSWSILDLYVREWGYCATVTGDFPNVSPGCVLDMEGTWVEHPKYGPQFEAKTHQESLPINTKGIEQYLASGLIKGIGPSTAKKIVAAFGKDTFDVIENDPDKLRKVRGLGKKAVEKIKASWEKQRAVKDIMMFLQECGVNGALAAKIYKQYGDKSIAVIKDNPYKLADDLWGVGFKTADAIAMKLGIDKNSYNRCRSGILYTMNRLADGGHCFATKEQLIKRAVTLLEVEEPTAVMTLDHMLKGDDLVRDEGDAIYLPAFYYSEVGVARNIKRLTAVPAPITETIDIKALEKKEGIEYDEVQIEAIQEAMASKVMVLTGGPGTGKTTVTKAIIAALDSVGMEIQLAAPTGRAAKRMSEATGMEARTIHRLLEYTPDCGYNRNEDNPIDGDVLIVDEASMIDIVLMNALVKALPDDMRFVLIGDIDQLPSVGAGNVLRDIIASEVVPVVRLTKIFRQAQSSKIIMNAHAINEGKQPDIRTDKDSDFFFIEDNNSEHAAKQIVDLVQWRLPGKYKVSPTAIQVLSPMKKGPLGTVALNEMLQHALNPCGISLTRNGTEYRLHDKVMQIKNNYDKGVFNGDIGYIDSVDTEDGKLSIQYDSGLMEYDLTDLDEVVLAYATTVHKSQGSEFPIVVMPVSMEHYIMLQRNLIYTGITRAKQLLVIVGTRRALGYAIQNVVITKRNSRLQARLTGG